MLQLARRRPSVPSLRSSGSRKAVETSNLVEIGPQHWAIVTSSANLSTVSEMVIVKVTRQLKCKNRFTCISSSKLDRYASNENDQRPILHISSNRPTFHQRKCFVFVAFVHVHCNTTQQLIKSLIASYQFSHTSFVIGLPAAHTCSRATGCNMSIVNNANCEILCTLYHTETVSQTTERISNE